MLEKIFSAATDVPIIIQGMIGSALFALVYFLGQKLYAYGKNILTKQNKIRRRRYLVEEIAKFHIATADNDSKRVAFMTLLIFRSLRSLFMALLWLTLGLSFSSSGLVLDKVGYLGAIYFLFQGLNSVRRPSEAEDKPKKLAELKAELAELKDAA